MDQTYKSLALKTDFMSGCSFESDATNKNVKLKRIRNRENCLTYSRSKQKETLRF